MAHNGDMSSTNTTTDYLELATITLNVEGRDAWFGDLNICCADAVECLAKALEATDGTGAWTPAGDDYGWTATPALVAETRRIAATVPEALDNQ